MLRDDADLRRFHVWRQALRSRRLNPHYPGPDAHPHHARTQIILHGSPT
ncbi:hypothetical protein [Paracoccus isoporae]|nr:hypothetical protein [Paracoccus isoporae]